MVCWENSAKTWDNNTKHSTDLLHVSWETRLEAAKPLIHVDSLICSWLSASAAELGQQPAERPETGATPTFCLTGDDKALGQGYSTWAIVLPHKMAFKCKFPLGPKGDLASALALLVWTNMWTGLICIMGRMEMRGQLCHTKTKRRKKNGGRLMPFCWTASVQHKGVISWGLSDHF